MEELASRTPESGPPSGMKLDLVIGAKEIGSYLGLAPRTVYYLAEVYEKTKEGPPIRRMPGYGLVASRARLRSYLEEQLGMIEEVPAAS